jgi:hypothetical protein
MRTTLSIREFLLLVFVYGAIGLGSIPKIAQAQDMTPDRMGSIIFEVGTDVEVGPNFWQFQVEGVFLMCIYDLTYDRMRIISPIIETDKMTIAQQYSMLQANFHSALDARYAISDGIVYSAYVHPLSSLQDADFESAIMQVAILGATFGTEYTSGALSFGGEQGVGGYEDEN